MNTCKRILLTTTYFVLITSTLLGATIPKITLVIVIDQLSYQTFERLSPHFNYGFKKLLENGINFTKAHHPHGNPVTATGHATISTGAYAKDHGVVLNGWMEEDGTFVDFGDDDAKAAAVFSKDGLYSYGLSAHHLLVETLSDKLILTKNPHQNFFVYAIAPKSRAAIAMAGKLGKAIWFDSEAKQYTSSKAYFNKMPSWLEKFNQRHNLSKLSSVSWPLAYDKAASAYKLQGIDDYRFAATTGRLATKTIKLSSSIGNLDTNNGDDEEFLYEQTPFANKALVELCEKCIDLNDLKPTSNHLMLWVSVSNFDALGHTYGHNSLEIADLLYHLDRQLDELITYAQKKVGKKKTLIVLTADHGCSPIPELLKTQGFYAARRLDAHKLKSAMNDLIEHEFGIKGITAAFKNTQYFLDHKKLNAQGPEKRQAILQQLKAFLKRQPGIKECWTKNDLEAAAFDPHHLEQYYKNQFHPQRSGDLILMPYPYTYITKYPDGTGHTCAYAYDTQVPLILYQMGSLEKRRVSKTVHITQLAPTLADILNVPCPAGALGRSLLP